MKLTEENIREAIRQALKENVFDEGAIHNPEKRWAQDELELMLDNNDGQFYNVVYDTLKKKALRGVQLDPQKLANARFVVDKVRQYAKELIEFIDGDPERMPTIEDRKNAALAFAERMIEAVNYDVENERKQQQQTNVNNNPNM